MSEWWSIEVFDAERRSSRRWKDAHQDELTEAAVTNGAESWEWHEHRHGVVFEVMFTSDAQWDAFRALPVVRAALDAAPDPVNGLIVYRGRGGGSGPRRPRRPKPAPGSSAMAQPEPREQSSLDLSDSTPPGERDAVVLALAGQDAHGSGARGRSIHRDGAGWGNEGKSSHD